MFNGAGLTRSLRYSLWAEAANHETDTTNLLVREDKNKCPHKLFYGTLPKYSEHLHPFGYVGFAKRNNVSFLGKLESRGEPCLMLGYATGNAWGTYRILNLKTTKIIK